MAPGDRDPLLLAARELRREVVAPRRQADPVDRLVDRHRVVDDVGDQGDVLAHREARDQVVELEHEADVAAPERGQLRLRGGAQVLIAKAHFAGARHVEPAQDVEERRLAAARGAEEDDELAGTDVEVDLAQGPDLDLAGAVGLGQAPARKTGTPARPASGVDRDAACIPARPLLPEVFVEGGEAALPARQRVPLEALHPHPALGERDRPRADQIDDRIARRGGLSCGWVAP
jgi:hypothetical protein